MNDHPFLVGLDPGTDSWRAVRMRVDGPRPEVLAAIVFSPTDPPPPAFFDDAALALTVPGPLAIVKYLAVPENGVDRRDRALLELAQSLTGDRHDYLLDVAPTGLNGLMLGMVIRQVVLDLEMLKPLTVIAAQAPGQAVVRGMALAHGYLAYCRPSRGGLLIMVDQGDRFTSISLIYRNCVVALAHLSTDRLDLSEPADRDRYAVELKTVVSFRLAALFDHGLTLPPSALIVSGEQVDDNLTSVLRKYFAVPIEFPDVNAGFLAGPLREQAAGMPRFLAAMGLAANLLA